MNLLEAFDLNSMDPNSIILIFGKKSTGKTVLIKHILETVAKDSKPTILTTNPEYGEYDLIKEKEIKEKEPNIILNKGYDENVIKNLVSSLRKNSRKPPKTNDILVLDDVLFDNNWMKLIDFRAIFMNNRQYKMGMIISMQYPLILLPILRNNVDYIFLFKNVDGGENIKIVKRIYENYFVEAMSEQEFMELYNKIDFENHRCIVYHINKNKVFSFKATI